MLLGRVFMKIIISLISLLFISSVMAQSEYVRAYSHDEEINLLDLRYDHILDGGYMKISKRIPEGATSVKLSKNCTLYTRNPILNDNGYKPQGEIEFDTYNVSLIKKRVSYKVLQDVRNALYEFTEKPIVRISFPDHRILKKVECEGKLQTRKIRDDYIGGSFDNIDKYWKRVSQKDLAIWLGRYATLWIKLD
jgi:hypothetical protein